MLQEVGGEEAKSDDRVLNSESRMLLREAIMALL
jgi:hypothetical protein